MTVELDNLVGVKGWKAVGNKFSSYAITKIREISGTEVVETEIKEAAAEPPNVSKGGSKDNGKSDVAIKKPPLSESDQTKKESDENVAPKQPKNETVKTGKKKTAKKDNTAQSKQEVSGDDAEESDGFHSGDTVDMKIDLSKLKKGRDQLGLFDE
jgi:hypothetical protein